MLRSDQDGEWIQTPHWEKHSVMDLFTERNECVAKKFKIKYKNGSSGFVSPVLASVHNRLSAPFSPHLELSSCLPHFSCWATRVVLPDALADMTSKRGAGWLIKGVLTHLSLCPSDPMICHKSKLPLRTSSTICLSTRPITLSGPRSRPGTGLPSVSLWLKELFLGMCFNIVCCFPGLITGLGISPGEGKGNPLQYSQLENSMDRGTWQAIVHGVTKSRTRLST